MIIRGLPGSGKSTLVDRLVRLTDLSGAKRLDPDLVEVNAPEFTRFCITRPKDLPLKKLIYRFLLSSACEELSVGGQVIWEQPWRKLELFRLTLENINVRGYHLSEIADYPFVIAIVEIYLPTDEVYRRVASRYQAGQHPLTTEDFADFVQSSDSFDGLNLPMLIVDGTLPLTTQVDSVVDFLRKVSERRIKC
ncbi:MAG: AAA family ATPase [bacterium]|nr:AAA family ATPase [bacterium]